jgi:hypothetical protein
MLRSLIEDIGDTIGFVVYIASYGPIYVVWNLVGKHVVRAFMHVIGQTQRHEVDLIIETAGSVTVMHKMLLRMYYNSIIQQGQQRLIGAIA